MGRYSVRAAAVVTLAALFTGSAVTASYGATPAGEVTLPTPIDSPTGSYIVLLDEAPVATYGGGESGLVATKPDEGEKLDTHSKAAKKYSAFLEKRQDEIATEVGVEPAEKYQITLNGFSTQMTPEQAAKVAFSKGVLGVYPDEIFHPDAVTPTDFLGLEGAGGVWASLGGSKGETAGAGVVVGVIDTGIAPENPSFEGAPLGADAGTEPYLDGSEVVFDKADGTQFRSDRVLDAEDWTGREYSTKLIGAKYFATGAAAAGYDFGPDFLSPRDADGHGSHTASTAAGNYAVQATVEGVDFGPISGVAPAAKIASYKACYAGPDPLVTTDDICAGSDLIAAIDAAVGDGVDVINYSIGGGAATTLWSADDIQFFNAAAAGVFVSVSAGNSGPDSSTADHGSPWYTTVAASTIPTYEGTVVLPAPANLQAAGATVSVPFGETVTGALVTSTDVAVPGAASANLCFANTLDPAKVSGKIVVCERGANARIEKSAEVKRAGGIGMILVNVTAGSLDNDFHSVPTIHIDAQYRAALLAYAATAGATASLVSGNITGVETPTPVVAGFSSRGPMLAAGSDIIKPDISAPGVAILAATQNGTVGQSGATPAFGFKSGTSMSAPHIAGLAALYLGVNPKATPDMIQSAMMTSAYDTVNADGTDSTDVFAQGAGHVDATRFLDPGAFYLNGPKQWAGFVERLGYYDFEGIGAADEIDGSQLNLASIGIGTLSKPEAITRTLTATRAGTYSASAAIPGVEVVVSPSTLTFAGPGDVQSYTVTFANQSAPVEEWATGYLSWTGGDGNLIRSPLAVKPVTADAPELVTGEGINGSVPVTIDSGVTGELPLNLTGLAPVELLTQPGDPVPEHSGDQDSGDANGNVSWMVEVPAGASLAQFTLDSSDDTATSDLDLFVYKIAEPITDPVTYSRLWQSATGSADEQVTITDPEPGSYMVVANMYLTSGAMTWDLTSAIVSPDGEGSLTAAPNPLPVTLGQAATYSLLWTGLNPETTYLGVVKYGDSAVRTLVQVDAGPAAPVATIAPQVSGTPKVGSTLKATPGTWDPTAVAVTYQWLRDGQPIEAATSQNYRVVRADVGAKLSVRVTATQTGNINTAVAVSNEVFVKFGSSTTVTVNRYVGTSSQSYAVTVAVTASNGTPATGSVNVWVGSKKTTGTLADGAVTFPLSKQTRGIKIVVAEYRGSDTVEGSAGISGFLVVR